LEAKSVKHFESHFLEGDSVIVGRHFGIRNNRYFHGAIDDIEIYDRVLTPAEVLQLHNAPNPNKNARIIRWILIAASVIVVAILILLWVRFRVRKAVGAEREKSRLNARILELETKALRAQMNPHFIFNSLNALQRFVLEDNKDKSYTYLNEFSKLLRKLLESSESEVISLTEEIEILRSYLEVEKLRFDNSFEYQLHSDIALSGQVYIPIMLVQPFAENAIWHGLLSRKGMRLLKITFTNISDDKLLCEVDDNGVGRDFKKKQFGEIKKKSLGLDLIRQRLELIRNATGVDTFFEIIDKTDNEGNSLGTTVRIIIPKMS
jgi:sensor histidine kinase YesM